MWVGRWIFIYEMTVAFLILSVAKMMSLTRMIARRHWCGIAIFADKRKEENKYIMTNRGKQHVTRAENKQKNTRTDDAKSRQHAWKSVKKYVLEIKKTGDALIQSEEKVGQRPETRRRGRLRRRDWFSCLLLRSFFFPCPTLLKWREQSVSNKKCNAKPPKQKRSSVGRSNTGGWSGWISRPTQPLWRGPCAARDVKCLIFSSNRCTIGKPGPETGPLAKFDGKEVPKPRNCFQARYEFTDSTH